MVELLKARTDFIQHVWPCLRTPRSAPETGFCGPSRCAPLKTVQHRSRAISDCASSHRKFPESPCASDLTRICADTTVLVDLKRRHPFFLTCCWLFSSTDFRSDLHSFWTGTRRRVSFDFSLPTLERSVVGFQGGVLAAKIATAPPSPPTRVG